MAASLPIMIVLLESKTTTGVVDGYDWGWKSRWPMGEGEGPEGWTMVVEQGRWKGGTWMVSQTNAMAGGGG